MSQRTSAREGGFILVAVLWILAALAGFVGVFALYASASVRAAVGRAEGHAASGLASAAVELAAHRLLATPKEGRPTHGDIAFRMGGAHVSAVFRDEAARIDLNAAPKELLAGLFAALGAQPDAALAQAERILAYRTPPRAGGRAAASHGAPFVHVAELWQAASLPPGLVAAALPYVTVYSGRGVVNMAEADPVVRAALALRRTKGDPPPDGQPPAGTTTQAGDTTRVTVRMDFDGGGHRRVEAVILLRTFGDIPYRVLDWREEVVPADAAGQRGG